MSAEASVATFAAFTSLLVGLDVLGGLLGAAAGPALGAEGVLPPPAIL